jgi:hypothetical protein
MIDIRLDIDAAAAQRALDRLDDQALTPRVAERVEKEVIRPALMQYPAPSGKKQAFASDKARRFFFAAVKSGRITVPYRRSGALGRDWQRTPNADGLTLTSTRPNSDLVRTQGKQAKYHKGTWPTDQQLVKEREGDAALAATAEIVEAIREAL